jgi:hypothetical protein
VTPLLAIGEWYVHRKEKKKGILAFRKSLSHNTTISPDGLLRLITFSKIMYLSFLSGNDQYFFDARKNLLDMVRIYAGVDAKTFMEVWLPALVAYEPTSVIKCSVRLFGLNESQLRQNREMRRQAWLREVRQARAENT